MNVIFKDLHIKHDWPWVQQHQDTLVLTGNTCGIIAVDLNTHEKVAACIMDTWTANSVHIHQILLKPMVLRYHFLECLFNYMFIARDVGIVYGVVPSDNPKSIKLAKHFGFTELMVLKDAWAVGVDKVMLELKRENCRYIAQPTQEKAA